ncbi:MAG: HigA family addiction module antitoxin [Clostridia bacterium]
MNKIQYDNLLAFHPGYYLKEFIEDLELTQDEFALRLDTTPKTISKLVNAQANMSNDIAKKLSNMLGTSVDLWLNLQNEYDKKVLEIQEKEALDNEFKLLKQIDYGFFEKLDLCDSTKDKSIRLKQLLAFLNVAKLSVLKNPKILVQYRQTSMMNSDEVTDRIITNVWVQTIINLGKEIQTQKYNEKKLLELIVKLRAMTVLQECNFIDDLKEMFAQCGVALVVIPSLKGSKVYAAVSWLNKDKVVLGITNRGLDSDKFWFSLFHEIKHILQNKKRIVIIDTQITTDLEKEANDFSADILIPKQDYVDFITSFKNSNFAEQDIINFAKEIQTHPGIVVGRMQKDKIIEYCEFNKLKCKYNLFA